MFVKGLERLPRTSSLRLLGNCLAGVSKAGAAFMAWQPPAGPRSSPYGKKIDTKADHAIALALVYHSQLVT